MKQKANYPKNKNNNKIDLFLAFRRKAKTKWMTKNALNGKVYLSQAVACLFNSLWDANHSLKSSPPGRSERNSRSVSGMRHSRSGL